MVLIGSVERNYWPDLSLYIDEQFTHYNNYIFRGQADADWELESTLRRALNANYKKPSEKKTAAQQHLKQFKENIRGRTSIDLHSATDDEIWAIGQHFGLNTPLLDWTRSPFVGLFFSLQGYSKSGKRVLWALFEEDIDRINETKKKDKSQVYIVNPLTHYNNRLVNQRGLFLHIPIEIELEKWVRSAKSFGWITMYKIVYPDSIRNEALSALNNMNINHLSLFPDLNGASMYSNYQLEIEPYLEQEQHKLWNKKS